MRLSEDRIHQIAGKIAFELVKKRFVISKHKVAQVTAWLEKPILEDLQREESINEEVRAVLAKMTTCPPEGSFEYNALFQRKKEELARRHGYEF